MMYGVYFGIKSWNKRIRIEANNMRALRNNLENFLTTMCAAWEDIGDYCYEFTLRDGTKHYAKLGFLD